MLHRDRLTARMEGEFAVFLIGMRINRPLALARWWPVAAAMPRMLRELYAQPALGLLSHEMWFSRTIILVQYWRSLDALLAYAKARDAAHLPAWQAFNRASVGEGSDGSVGIWHETYLSGPGRYENVYVNMPAFGLGRAGQLVPAAAGLQSAAGRLRGAEARTD
ncbi:MAG: DUF4188 domain-containing protein [Roseateles sp.]|jgi:hypothetical protein|nr:DUF4188 domain-containing protein [Methylibium sp.]RTL18161.1 MAG: DUF4188 domain-containing protein [Burkholderiales bacterium]